jgi:hypothetical protein
METKRNCHRLGLVCTLPKTFQHFVIAKDALLKEELDIM